MRLLKIFLSASLLLLPMVTQAANAGAPIEVAAKAPETRNQSWASLAWSAEAKCWLVVWREGYLNEKISDIWCARISADGKTMDPAGIKLTSGKGTKDIPRVASNGKGFLVIWDDFRNGKDWDVYATCVSGKGIVANKEPILIAGGEHNQCRPAIAFAKGNYFVEWMGFVDGVYSIYGVRVSPEGKIVGNPTTVATWEKPKKKKNKPKQGILPVLAANSNGDMLTSCYAVTGYQNTQHLTRRMINAETGEPLGPLSTPPKTLRNRNVPGICGWYRERCASITMGPNTAMLVCSGFARLKSEKEISACLLAKNGDIIVLQELASTLANKNKFKPLMPRPTTAFDGKNYLVISDCQFSLDKKKTRDPKHRIRLIGWQITPTGKVVDPNGFMIAGEGDLDCMLPAVAAGPAGTCLVVYSEIRGVDNVKILARVIK